MNKKITGKPQRKKAHAALRGAPAASTETAIAAHIAQMRAQMGMTLDQLAAATGFTKSYLSKIENSKKVPPIGTLSRIARALKTDITEILRTQKNGRAFCVVRVKDRQPVVRGGTAFGYDYQSLAHTRAHKKMEPFLFTFPSEIDKYVFFEHEGEEFIFVLRGKVEWQAGGEKVILKPGDSIYFDSRLPHRGRGLGGEASALVVAYSPEE